MSTQSRTCPFCSTKIFTTWSAHLFDEKDTQLDRIRVRSATCPECGRVTLMMDHGAWVPVHSSFRFQIAGDRMVHPDTYGRKPVPAEVPADLAEDCLEARAVVSVSPKASAALSRRVLQALLRQQGYPQHDLAKQIDAVLHEPDARRSLPSALHESVDAIRSFGNFSAHPVTDLTTLQIVAVEEGEADWCLELIDELFDHFYVKPAVAKRKKDALNAKLAAAGKPPAK